MGSKCCHLTPNQAHHACCGCLLPLYSPLFLYNAALGVNLFNKSKLLAIYCMTVGERVIAVLLVGCQLYIRQAFRMSNPPAFNSLCATSCSIFAKHDTDMRDAVLIEKRLAIFLDWAGSGSPYQSHMHI